MTYRLAWASEEVQSVYRELRADLSDELGKLVKQVLEDLRDDPASVRARPMATRFSNGLWGFVFDAPDGTRWLVAWEEMPDEVIKLHYIGPAPGEVSKGGPTYTSESEPRQA